METSRELLKGRLWEFALIYGLFLVFGMVYYPSHMKWFAHQPSTWVMTAFWIFYTYVGYTYPIPYRKWVLMSLFVYAVYTIWLFWTMRKKIMEDVCHLMSGENLIISAAGGKMNHS